MSHFQIKNVLAGIIDAVDYLHSMNIVHRDIKPENILQSERGEFKLCDFGFSAKVGYIKGKLHRRQTYCGTPEYFAPEIINGQEQTEKVDIWTIGVLIYELLHHKAPFKDN